MTSQSSASRLARLPSEGRRSSSVSDPAPCSGEGRAVAGCSNRRASPLPPLDEDGNEVAQRKQMPRQSAVSPRVKGEEQKEEGWALELILPVIALLGLGGFTVFKQVMQKRQERDGYSSVPTATGMPGGIEDGDVALGTLATDQENASSR